MRKSKRKLVLALAGTLAVLFLIFLAASKSATLPPEFVIARGKAADTGNDIVNLTNQTLKMIQSANVFDSNGNYDRALTLITSARANNNDAYNKASILAQHLKDLAESLNLISSRESRQLAYESIAVELSLVSEFIVYTNRLNAFLEALRVAVSTNALADRRAAEEYLRGVNEQARAINAINQDFLSRIGDFDASLR